MQQQHILEQRELSREELMALRNKRTGVTVFQISWIMVFICLIVVNLQLRGNFASWPPPGVESLDKVLPTLATIGLLVSMALARMALKSIQREQVSVFKTQWGGALALGAGFLVIMAFQWFSVPFSGQYSTVFRVMIAYHAIHAVVIGTIMIYVYRNAASYDAVHNWAVEAAAKLWYFVTIAWVLFYIVIYLM